MAPTACPGCIGITAKAITGATVHQSTVHLVLVLSEAVLVLALAVTGHASRQAPEFDTMKKGVPSQDLRAESDSSTSAAASG